MLKFYYAYGALQADCQRTGVSSNQRRRLLKQERKAERDHLEMTLRRLPSPGALALKEISLTETEIGSDLETNQK